MTEELIVELRGVSKRFGEVRALDDVDFTAQKGEIHGLLGENGAGKSTLMKILYGLYSQDEGTVSINGKETRISSPYDSIQNGIGMVHQVSTLVGEFTAVENIIMGTDGDSFSLHLDRERKKIRALSEKFGLPFPLDSKVVEQSAGIKQKIEIVRALYHGASLLILDEPTTSLVESEFQQLLVSLQALVENGVTVIFITHKIREVMVACHAATVLRKGKVQGVLGHDEMSQEKLVKLMFMEKDIAVNESALPTVEIPASRLSDKPVLELVNVRVAGGEESPGLKGVSLQVFGGEIVGVAGVSGNGEKEIAEVVVNPLKATGGDILVKGESVMGMSTLDVFARGVFYTPEDRISEGILNEGSITENILLGHHAEKRFLSRKVFVAWDEVRRAATKAVEDYNIYTPSIDLNVRRLSGGNIQKAIIARAFASNPSLLVTHNPTSGLDISTVEFIFNQLVQTRCEGAAVLWVNEDLDELMVVSDRIAVLHGGEVKGVFNRDEFDKYKIGLLMLGGE
jgi:general nucleoside transport system ATP-binding protein